MNEDFLNVRDLPIKAVEYFKNLYSNELFVREIRNIENIIYEKYISENYLFNVVVNSNIDIDLLKAHFIRNGFNVKTSIYLDEEQHKINGLMFKL